MWAPVCRNVRYCPVGWGGVLIPRHQNSVSVSVLPYARSPLWFVHPQREKRLSLAIVISDNITLAAYSNAAPRLMSLLVIHNLNFILHVVRHF